MRISASLNTAIWMVLWTGCGGTAVVDGDAAGGGGSATTSSTSSNGSGGMNTSVSSSNSSGSGGSSCNDAADDVTAAVLKAQACDPLINALQCSGMTVVIDTCGCVAVANDLSQDAAEFALAAYDAWVGAGCSPYRCDSCPPPPDSPWYCDPDAGKCLPAFD
jgi:hypothetical protein